jgi:hypothetical protein
MAASADEVATLRTYLAGDYDEYQRMHGRLDPVAARTGYTALIAAAFFEAVDRRFAKPGTTAADIIQYVGDVRARSARIGDALDPRAAERVVRHALGDGSIADLNDETVIGTQIVMLSALIADEQLDDAGLDAFMAAARKLADQWTA